MLNNVTLMGRLVRDPELRHTQTSNVPVTTYTLAANRLGINGTKEVDFFDIIAWKNAAEFAATYFHKGQLIAIQGRLQTRKWVDKEGKNRVSTEIVAERQYFAESKNKDESAAPQYAAAENPSFASPDSGSYFAEIEDDGDLPF